MKKGGEGGRGSYSTSSRQTTFPVVNNPPPPPSPPSQTTKKEEEGTLWLLLLLPTDDRSRPSPYTWHIAFPSPSSLLTPAAIIISRSSPLSSQTLQYTSKLLSFPKIFCIFPFRMVQFPPPIHVQNMVSPQESVHRFCKDVRTKNGASSSAMCPLFPQHSLLHARPPIQPTIFLPRIHILCSIFGSIYGENGGECVPIRIMPYEQGRATPL